jgi:hypothetical protein
MARAPYHAQYESSDDPWPTSVGGWLVWVVFFFPGSCVLWFDFMYPRRGEVWASGRRAQNKIVIVLTSLSIYIAILVMAIILLASAARQSLPR